MSVSLPRRLRPIHVLPLDRNSTPELERSFYNAVWCAVRDRVHPGGNLKPSQALKEALSAALDERNVNGYGPQFPVPIVECYSQWLQPDSALHGLALPTVAHVAVEAFFAEKAAFEASDAFR